MCFTLLKKRAELVAVYRGRERKEIILTNRAVTIGMPVCEKFIEKAACSNLRGGDIEAPW